MKKTFEIGDEVYVRDPGRFVEGATCIVGTIATITRDCDDQWVYWLFNEGNPATFDLMRFQAADLGKRIGTPLSQLGSQPGQPGWEKFCAIARSWGYD